MKDVFLIARDPEDNCRDLIYHRGSSLKMRVTCINGGTFIPDPDELQFYVDNNGEILAFETSNYDMSDPGLIIEAIRWYARYIGNPGLEILAEDPTASGRNSSYKRN